jgi:aspartate aminotransferase-like enzyme
VKQLKARFGTIVANGQGEMKGQLFRVAHLGFFDPLDTLAVIGALEQVTVDALPPSKFQLGDALAAAQRVFAERSRALDKAASNDSSKISVGAVPAGVGR